jgi:hypothetical protein
MNKREAKRIAEEDTTPYGVRDGAALYRVTGYRNAKIIRGNKAGAVILTASEMERLAR